MRLLLESDDVDINAEDRRGGTALSVAAANRHEGIVQLLQNHGRQAG